MKKSIFINAMSRNGSSLIFQLLAGHKDIFLYPPRIEIACSNPRGWPFFACSQISLEKFFEELSKKHFVDIGDRWDKLKHVNILEDKNFQFAQLKKNVLGVYSNIGDFVNEDNLYKFFINYCEEFINLYSQVDKSKYKASNYLVFQDDHLYNFGPQNFTNCNDKAYFIQVIRNYIDVVASRKNMLLHHLEYQGDPRLMTLKPSVINAEVTRCFWNIICAYLNYKFDKDKYIVLKFENLHKDRKNSMLHVCNKLGIEFDNILLQETKYNTDLLVMNGLLLTESSLAKVSKGKSNIRVNSYTRTLNEEELHVINEIEKTLDYMFPSDVNEIDIYSEIEKFYKLNGKSIKKNGILSRWLELYYSNKFDVLMDEYSKLNYGKKNAKEAFR